MEDQVVRAGPRRRARRPSRRPSGARPNLWPDALIDFTRGRRKSQTRSGSTNGAMKPPLAPSTWIGMSSPVSACSLSSAAADVGDRLVLAGERDAERRHDADGVLVDPLESTSSGVHDQPVALHRDLAMLDVPVAGELVPADLDRTGDQVRPVGRLAGGAPALAPLPQQRHPAEHRRLARAGGRGARACSPRPGSSTGRRACARSAPRARRSAGTRPCRSCSCRSTASISSLDLGLDPRLAERRQVLARVAVEHQLVVHDLVGVPRRSCSSSGNRYFGIDTDRSLEANTSSSRASRTVRLLCNMELCFLGGVRRRGDRGVARGAGCRPSVGPYGVGIVSSCLSSSITSWNASTWSGQ